MAQQTRNSVLAIVTESTEGTPIAPSGATDFVALQEGFDFSPTFESLETSELRGSIGSTKPITGLETPSVSLSHYIRHSGVEGQAPNYDKLLHAAFGGKTAAGTQRTVTSATTSTITVGAGQGTEFERGKPLLIKDGTNGYLIRPVHSVATDTLTLGFRVGVAPAAATQLGRAVLYKPANANHPSLSLWEYRANAGALEVISGARVTEFSMEVEAGQLINGSFSLEGVKYHFNPINILAADTKLDFLDNATTRVATIAAKLYRDPHEVAQAIQDSMNALGSANTFTVIYNDKGASAGKFTISSTGTTLSLLWATGVNTANTVGDKIGFNIADDTGALTYTSDNVQSWGAPFTPSYDSADPLVAKANECFIGDSLDTDCFCVSSLTATVSNERTPIPCICEESGVSGSVINARQVTVELVALLNQHDAEKFKRFRANEETRFLFNFGEKSGGNWVAGKCGSLYIPTATISNFKMGDLDGLVVLEMTLTAFVDANGLGEAYLGFV